MRFSISIERSCAVSIFRFVLFQLRSGKSLGIHQRLFAFIIVGTRRQVGLGDLNVVSEDRVDTAPSANQSPCVCRSRSSIAAIALPPAMADRPQFVQFRIDTLAAMTPPSASVRGGSCHQVFWSMRSRTSSSVSSPMPAMLATTRRAHRMQRAFSPGSRPRTRAQRHARRAAPPNPVKPCQQPFQVQNPAKRPPNLLAAATGRACSLGHRLVARFNRSRHPSADAES